jgi:hypothetical protein
MVFDTAGFCGAARRREGRIDRDSGLRIVFATDYPQEIRERAAVRDFVKELRARYGRRGDPVRQCRQAARSSQGGEQSRQVE